MPGQSQARGDRTRARLREAAVLAFSRLGFHATTTRDIADAAGMSPAAVYVHYRTKEELLFAIARSGHEVTLRLVQAALDGADGPTEQLASAIREFVIHHARDHTTARVINYELGALTEAHGHEISRQRRQIDSLIRSTVETGVRAGEFDTPDPAKCASALLSMGIDLARWYRDDGGWTPEALGDFYADAALRMVGAPSPF